VPIDPQAGLKLESPDATDAEPFSRIGVWQTISQHTDEVCQEVDKILKALSISEAEVLRIAARWHDWGKAHPVFQNAIDDGQLVQRNGRADQRRKRPQNWQGNHLIAKAPGKVWRNEQLDDPGFWQKYERPHFRHELASALAVLLPDVPICDIDRNLIAYLIASHHGKVRLSIRSLPHENKPQSNRHFARGVWDDDKLPQTDLGNGVIAPAVILSLEPMELGLCESPPFRGQSSWTERMLHLRDMLGPFRLAYLEAILRAADMRASRKAEQPVTPSKESGK
jgi:CRISPR-associated endonuclease/helicase Cas3